MDSFELNKLIGAFLGTVFVVFSISLVSDAIFAAPVPERPGFVIAVTEEESGGGGGGEAAAQESVLPLLASADLDKGAAVFKKCAACHTDDAGGANKVGPNLWGVVNRPIASHEGFSYSGAMKEFSQGGSVKWDYEHLDHFLLSPKGLVKGTAMGFAGLKKIDERADVIAYLRSKADSPEPLPEASAAPAPENASAPAEGEAAPEAPAE
jgi:cytochrome c